MVAASGQAELKKSPFRHPTMAEAESSISSRVLLVGGNVVVLLLLHMSWGSVARTK